ncbi:MAG: AAA family ATPase [Pseudomonadota bacterium]
MYLEFFGLHERPFTITPDPRYLFMSERHAEALAHLIYGVTESDGFIVLTGEVGTGKTTLVRSLLQKMPDAADVALILNPQLNAIEFLRAIIQELGITPPQDMDSARALTEALNDHLLDAHTRGRRTIAVVDEAQNLSAEVLEQIRLLTNLETTRDKLLQIVLIGQPELRELLARNDLRQLSQRVTARYHLLPLNVDEAAQYLDHRLAVAGALQPILGNGAKKRIHTLAHGIPRLMNLIADRALLGAWSREQKTVDKSMVDAAAEEVFGKPMVKRMKAKPWPQWATIGIAAALVLATIAVSVQQFSADPAPVVPVQAAIAERRAAIEPAPQTLPPVQAQIETVPTEPPRPSLNDWLVVNRDKTGTTDSFATLFEQWSLTYNPLLGNPCEQARTQQLRCVADSGALAGLLLFDRPAIMTLRDLAGEAHQVVLTAFADNDVTLRVADASITLPAAELVPLWFGEYLLLWRPPNNRVVTLRPGSRGENVLWLRQSLTAILGRDIPPQDSRRYDDEMVAFVREYQRARRLTVDGVVGPRTQMMIIADLGMADTPRLQTTRRALTATRAAE